MPDRKTFLALPLCRKVVAVVVSPGGWTKGEQNSYQTIGQYVEPEIKKNSTGEEELSGEMYLTSQQ